MQSLDGGKGNGRKRSPRAPACGTRTSLGVDGGLTGICQWSSPKLQLTGLSGQGEHCRQTLYLSFVLPPCSEWSLTKSKHFLVSIQAFLSSQKRSQEHLICNSLLQYGGSRLRQTWLPRKPSSVPLLPGHYPSHWNGLFLISWPQPSFSQICTCETAFLPISNHFQILPFAACSPQPDTGLFLSTHLYIRSQT